MDLRGWFSDAEGAWYAKAVAAAVGDVVEVGSWRGRSTSYLAAVLAGEPQRLTCVDHWAGSSDAWDGAYRARLADAVTEGRSVRACFEQNMAALGIPLRVLALPSLLAAPLVADGTCGLVFLDASHDQPAVAADLRAWWPKVAADGRLAGHDYAPTRHPGLVAAVDRFVAERGVMLTRGPGSLYVLARPSA